MDIDARTQETAAALLGVACKIPGITDSRRNAQDSIGTGPATFSATSPPTVASVPTNPPVHSFSTLSETSLQPQQRRLSQPSQQPQPRPQLPQHQHQHQHNQTQNQFQNRPQHASSTGGPQPHLLHPPLPSSDAVLAMSSIGFGIDSSSSAAWGDATEAAVRALQDAMERSTLRLPMSTPAQHLLQIRVQLGVPPKQIGSIDPMVVDVSRLTSILPRAIPVLPIRVVVGGLFLKGEANGSPSICTAVACITLQSQAPITMPEPPIQRTRTAAATAAVHSSPWASLETNQQKSPSQLTSPTVPEGTTVATARLQSEGTEPTVSSAPVSAPASAPAPAPAPVLLRGSEQPSDKQNVSRSTSIEMLAMISEEIRLASNGSRNSSFAPMDGQGMEEMDHKFPAYPSSDQDVSSKPPGLGLLPEGVDMEQIRNGNYNYKKLPPGVTTKNNRRLFVKHTYRDHSGEKPLPEELDLVGSSGTSSARTPNAAFPLKLHETLTQIETNGHGDIIGWMAHGRSFKIHKQKEFAEIILPRYFVMTKKSSFLRQLNLYGFNRFSAGPDQGSYYHEKFLRGMKFLCRRMTRQKVNGNRIRSAGNPDEEPMLCGYPSCPPPIISTANQLISSLPSSKHYSYISKDEGEEREDDDTRDGQKEREQEKTMQNALLQRNNGGVLVSFPLKLQRMLDKLEAERDTDIISWLPHGRAFIVHDPEAFVEHLMPVYFNQTKYSSFQRQLHMYNFQRITAGRDKGAYHNPNFQRGRPHLCTRMVRTRVNGKGCRKPGNPSNEPNLYSMEPLSPIAQGTNIEVPIGIPNQEVDDESDSVDS